MSEDPNVTVAKFSFKQAIIVAAITGATTLGGTLLTQRSNNSNGGDSVKEEGSSALAACQEQNEKLSEELKESISFSSLTDISNTHFQPRDAEEEIKNSIRSLVQRADEYAEDSNHFTYKLFKLKKLMLINGGNINVRISSANKEACVLIQDLLKGIEYYKGTVDGNVESTREAVEKFQRTLNQFTEGYFEERNIGIVGKKTFNAILERYEKND